MVFEAITLDKGEKINAIRQGANHKTSSHAFVSLYLWKNAMGLSVAFSENAFLIKSANGYFFPCGQENEVLAFLEAVLENEPNARFFYTRAEDVELTRSVFGERVTAAYDASSREYLYNKNEQIAMSGKKFTYQRAKVNKARRLGVLTSRVLDASCADEARKITVKWAERRADKGDLDETLEALEGLDELSLYGNLLSLDGEPIGFNLGSFIAEDTFDIHIAKTLIDDVDTLMKWELYKSLPEAITTINREEDLGIRGLAIHKQDGQPSAFNDTFILSFDEE